ncbi:MAG: hypothetical protein K2R93_14490 [Gemmatimonadaceae bacterium]|nr:hypothetical protein [Gemmatimonadaceae bacterium]
MAGLGYVAIVMALLGSGTTGGVLAGFAMIFGPFAVDAIQSLREARRSREAMEAAARAQEDRRASQQAAVEAEATFVQWSAQHLSPWASATERNAARQQFEREQQWRALVTQREELRRVSKLHHAKTPIVSTPSSTSSAPRRQILCGRCGSIHEPPACSE